MKDKEILEFLKDNEENNYNLEISATFATILAILIKNGLTTQKEFDKIKKQYLKQIRKTQVENMSDEDRLKIEAVKKFNDLFGKTL